jgi:hypothetical protein
MFNEPQAQRLTSRGFIMNRIEQILKSPQTAWRSNYGFRRDLAKHFQAIAAAHADYAKSKEGAAFFEKLASAKSLQEAIEIRAEYTKTGYAAFVAESKRIGEMYNELSKIALKPFGGMNRENVPSDR